MSPINIQDQMRRVINTFLEYHCWRPNPITLDAYATADREKGGYFVVVTIDRLIERLEKDADDIRTSLQWVLQALFDYPEYLGIVSYRFSEEKREGQ